MREVIVVEGRDDTAAIKRALDADTIETHGFGIRKETWELIEEAYRKRGIIIFTDPDYSGEEIRRKLSERFPDAKHAYLTQDEATSKGDIGIENASPSSILSALEKVHFRTAAAEKTFSMQDLVKAGLCGKNDAKEKRQALGKALGVGYGSNRRFLEKLNAFGITREEFEKAVAEVKK